MKTAGILAAVILVLGAGLSGKAGSAADSAADKNVQTFELKVTDAGFVPKSLEAKPGIPVVLKVTRTTDDTCAKQIQVPSLKIGKKPLPLNKTVTLKLGKLEAGEIRFGCGMSMMEGGSILVK